LLKLDGQEILPSVSVPRVKVARPIEVAMPEPEDELQADPLGKYAFDGCPPRADHPGAPIPLPPANSAIVV
jgi:hypothetical protein